MSPRLNVFILKSLVVILSVYLSACATASDLVSSGTVQLRIQNTPRTSIEDVRVLSTREETVVYGKVQRLGVYNNPFVGKRVVAKAIFPDGSVDEQEDTLLMRSTPGVEFYNTMYPKADFKVSFDERFPTGTVLTLNMR